MREIFIKSLKNYKILIGNGILKDIGKVIKNTKNAKKAVIITDKNVEKIYGKSVKESLKSEGMEVSVFSITPGEESKNLRTVEKIYKHLSDNEILRKDLIIALGGGVCGDIAGFVAATYLRGIDYINIPTSLLAQVDSSVGGKVGVNLSTGKNLVGAFYPPSLVYIDYQVLNTLPTENFSEGMAEVIKYGAICDKSLLELIKKKDVRKENIEEIIYRCLKYKKNLVEEDEFDSGKRQLLNFGHTFGHAIENYYKYSKFSHGEAVSIGMAEILKRLEIRNMVPRGSYAELIHVLKKYKLPISTDISGEELFKGCLRDKKFYSDDEVNIVLIKDLGKGYIQKMTKREFYKFTVGGKINEYSSDNAQ